MDNLTGQNCIASEWIDGKGPEFFGHNPASGQDLPTAFREADATMVQNAVEAAYAAFADYRRLPYAKRADLLDAIAEQIEALGDALIELASAETGLPAARLTGERARTCNQLRMFSTLVREGSWVDARIDHAIPHRQPLPKPDIRRLLVPIGPIGVFGASNFPLAFSVAGGDTASALAAGCPVVVKAHPAHPGTSELVARALVKAVEGCGMPKGVFSMLHGGAAVGQELVRSPWLAGVGFTGSHAAGRALFNLAAARQRPIPVFAEMGSVNPIFVLPGALAERAKAIGEGFAGSVSLGVGQFCTKPGILAAVEGEGWDTLVETAAGKLAELQPQAMLTPGIADRFKLGCQTWLGHPALKPVLAPGEKEGSHVKPGLWTAKAASLIEDAELREELFGPVALLVECADLGEMERLCQALHGQLTASLHWSEQDEDRVPEWLDNVASICGRVVANGYPTGVEVCAALQHGGPYPASTDSRYTSVGTAAILRWVRPVAFQAVPEELLPEELQDDNPTRIHRTVDGKWAAPSE